jgi:C-terminal processing protease CtpA/Prc
MTSKTVGLVAVSILVLAPAALAGDYEKCGADAQSCLNQLAARMQGRGWVGIELDVDDAGTMTVRRVVEGSPALAAGFEVGDRLVALDGMAYADASAERKRAAREAMVPGKRVTYTVLRGGSETELRVTLGKVPRRVMAQWIGDHMLGHVTVAQAD